MKITIPPAALEAGARAIKDLFMNDCPATYDEIARAAFEAMVGAWEGMANCKEDYLGPACLILPLPQEASDE